MGMRAKETHQTVYVREVLTSSWQAFRAEALRRGLGRAEALELMIAEWLKKEES